MSSKQMKKLILIIASLVVVVATVFVVLFFVDFDSLGNSNDIEKIKAEGGYEQFKSDLISSANVRDSQAATIANIFFEDIGVKKYEGIEQGGCRGTHMVHCDGYNIDALIRGGEFANAYIGNVLIYKNPKVASSTVANAPNYTYSQYQTIVDGIERGMDISEDKAKEIFEKLNLMDISSFSSVKSGKLNGVKGFYGYENKMQYFITLNSDSNIDKIFITCDGFDPIEVYNSSTSTGNETSTTYKLLNGPRSTLPDSLNYKIAKLIGEDTNVMLPAALMNGDDGWLAVKNNDELYLEVKGEVINGEKREVKDFVIRTTLGREILYLKVGNKVYLEK